MLIQIIWQLALIMIGFMSFTFIFGWLMQNNNVLDIAWGLGFIMVALFTINKNGLYLPAQLLATTLVIAWAFRITVYLFIRNYGKPEDIRFVQAAAHWGNRRSLYSFIFFYLMQGALTILICIPLIFINSSSSGSLTFLSIIGAAIWLLGISIETIADIQLYTYLKNPAHHGLIMQSGLWKYSRHPNYFGEITLWWGIWLIALSIPYGWMTIVGPVTITSIILFLSGTPMTEKQLSKLAGFQEYKAKTSVL